MDMLLPMIVARPMQGGFGAKALAIMAVCAQPKSDRTRYYPSLCERFSEKSVKLKMQELFSRGYLESPGLSSLTPRGRHVLESQPRG